MRRTAAVLGISLGAVAAYFAVVYAALGEISRWVDGNG